jgi:hypothetical protein
MEQGLRFLEAILYVYQVAERNVVSWHIQRYRIRLPTSWEARIAVQQVSLTQI